MIMKIIFIIWKNKSFVNRIANLNLGLQKQLGNYIWTSRLWYD